jgi:hypothetical protein
MPSSCKNWNKVLKKLSYHVCREARQLCDSRMYDTLLVIAIQDPVKRELNPGVWAGLSELNGEFLQPMHNAEDVAERRAKSRTVQDKAVEFVTRFTDVCGMECATL